MPQTERAPAPEIDRDLVRAYAETFVGRWDLTALQRADGRYVAIRRRLILAQVGTHLAGRLTLGAYALDAQNRARWLCLDADDDAHWSALLEMARGLQAETLPAYLETSRRGGHLWLFFEQPISGADARRFGRALLAVHNVEGVELFPKQDALTTGPGSLVRLPLGVHRKTGARYPFLTSDGESLAESIRAQVEHLAFPARVSMATLADLLNSLSEPQPTPTNRPTAHALAVARGELLSERLKRSISVYDFISRYVVLDERGMGLCPFHDDHSPSFSVNASENYWHCFAGCGGGSIIDFAIRWRAKHGGLMGRTSAHERELRRNRR